MRWIILPLTHQVLKHSQSYGQCSGHSKESTWTLGKRKTLAAKGCTGMTELLSYSNLIWVWKVDHNEWPTISSGISYWAWDQRHYGEQHFCFLLGIFPSDREGWSAAHFPLQQTWWIQLQLHTLSTIPSSPTCDVLAHSSYDMPGLAPLMNVLFWGQQAFRISFSGRDMSMNVWNCLLGSSTVDKEISTINIAVLNTNAPLPQHAKSRLDLWPTDLNVNRDHPLIKDYLPTKFEASGAKRCWVFRCTRFERLKWPLTLTFDLLTWLSIGIIYSSRTIYLPSLKLLGQRVVELTVAQGLKDWHGLWPWPLTYQPDYQ